MTIIISMQSPLSAYEQIKEQIKQHILSGELRADEALPSMRSLAKELRVSMITTTRAYSDLEAEGLIYTVQGRGCFVKNNADLIKEQYIKRIDETLQIACEKSKAIDLPLDKLISRLNEIYKEIN
ncbi:MAG: GntR family transcriptional regulator [Ruminococcus sp.]|nr:GntR family transcriptional regulator [Ruminococcus sp.]